MTANPNSIALAHGGSLILQDGLSDDGTQMSWVNQCYNYEWEFQGGSELIRRHASALRQSVFSNSKYEPMIVVFEPEDIASVGLP